MGGNFQATATAGKEKHTKGTKKGKKKASLKLWENTDTIKSSFY